MRWASPQRLLRCSGVTSDLPKPSSQIRRCNKASTACASTLSALGIMELGDSYALPLCFRPDILERPLRYGSASPRRLLQCSRATHETCNILPTFVPHSAMQYGCSRGMSIKTYRCWGARSWVHACISAAAVLSTGRIGLSLRFTVLVIMSPRCLFILGPLCLVPCERSSVVAR
jgi:hypothetical protein